MQYMTNLWKQVVIDTFSYLSDTRYHRWLHHNRVKHIFLYRTIFVCNVDADLKLCQAINYTYCWKKWNNIYVRVLCFLNIANRDLIHSREYLLSWVRISFLCPALIRYPLVHRTLAVWTTLLTPMVPCCSTVLFLFSTVSKDN